MQLIHVNGSAKYNRKNQDDEERQNKCELNCNDTPIVWFHVTST
jgi:hypothetical protein